MLLSTFHNDHGVPVVDCICDTCGAPFTITPAPRDMDGWGCCLDWECGSYDPARDADALFEAGLVERDDK